MSVEVAISLNDEHQTYVREHRLKNTASGDRQIIALIQDALPRPPHEWKVGDWFVYGPDDSFPERIVDIFKGEVHTTYRHDDGLYGSNHRLDALISMTPCNPPVWFTDE